MDLLLKFHDLSEGWKAPFCLAIPTVALLYLYRWLHNPLRNIPGPIFRLPIIGHLHLLGKKTHIVLTRLQKKYGDVYTMRIGPHQAVIISGKETIKSMCSLEPVYGRPHKLFNSWQKHERYFAFGHSEVCKRYRKATVRALAQFTKHQLDEAVNSGIDSLIENICKNESGEQQTALIRSKVADVSYFMCFGEKQKSRNDAEFQHIMSSLQDILAFAKQAGIADLFPWALHIPSVKKSYDLFAKGQDDLVRLVKNQEKRHDINRNDEKGHKFPDLCDLLQASIPYGEQQKLLRSDVKIGTLSEQTGMLLVAGYETVAVTLLWVILLLAAHPQLQEEIFIELRKSTGKKSLLLEAFILETLRFSMASPLAMPHMTTETVEINGYVIPKDTLILINLWSGSRDERIWGYRPDLFDPSRFLHPDGQVNTAIADHLVAFGSGRRRCVGEQLAKSHIHRFTEELISRCQIKLANKEKIDYWPEDGNGRNVPPVTDLKFTLRTQLHKTDAEN